MAIPVIAGVLLKVAGPIIAAKIGQKLSKRETDDMTAAVVKEIVDQVTADPVVKNEMNAEQPYQSRVAWGSVIAALGVLVPVVANILGYEVSGDRVIEIGSAIITLGGAGYALYGRFKSGLKPLFAAK